MRLLNFFLKLVFILLGFHCSVSFAVELSELNLDDSVNSHSYLPVISGGQIYFFNKNIELKRPEDLLKDDLKKHEFAISNGRYCGISRSKKIICWGSLGRFRKYPVPLEIKNPLVIIGRDDYFCAIDEYKGVFCWGYYYKKRFYFNSYRLNGIKDPVTLSPGFDNMTCVTQKNSKKFCWKHAYNVQYRQSNDNYKYVSYNKSRYEPSVCYITYDDEAGCTTYVRHDDKYSKLTARKVAEAEKIVSTKDYACVLNKNKKIICWGDDYYQVEDVPLKITDPTDLHAFIGAVCAEDKKLGLVCWGKYEESTQGIQKHYKKGNIIFSDVSSSNLTSACLYSIKEGVRCFNNEINIHPEEIEQKTISEYMRDIFNYRSNKVGWLSCNSKTLNCVSVNTLGSDNFHSIYHRVYNFNDNKFVNIDVGPSPLHRHKKTISCRTKHSKFDEFSCSLEDGFNVNFSNVSRGGRDEMFYLFVAPSTACVLSFSGLNCKGSANNIRLSKDEILMPNFYLNNPYSIFSVNPILKNVRELQKILPLFYGNLFKLIDELLIDYFETSESKIFKCNKMNSEQCLTLNLALNLLSIISDKVSSKLFKSSNEFKYLNSSYKVILNLNYDFKKTARYRRSVLITTVKIYQFLYELKLISVEQLNSIQGLLGNLHEIKEIQNGSALKVNLELNQLLQSIKLKKDTFTEEQILLINLLSFLIDDFSN